MRGYRSSLYLFGIFTLITISQAAGYERTAIHYNQVEILNDRLLVTGGEETRKHVATWTVLVTLDVPQEEPRLRTDYNVSAS